MCAKIAKKRSIVSSVCSLSCEKKWKKLVFLLINWSVDIQKLYVHTRILLLWQKVSGKRYQPQFTVVPNNWTFRRYHWDEFCTTTFVWRHTKFNWFRSWSQLTIQCVFDRPTIDLQKIPILAEKIIFWDEAHCRILGIETCTHTLKSQRTQNESLFGMDFGSES